MGDNNKEALANCMEKLKALEQKQRERLAKAICNPSTRFAITPNGIDWEHRRYEIAKESLVAIMSNDEFYAQVLYESAQLNERRGIPYNISRAAVVFADTLIAELQQGGEK